MTAPAGKAAVLGYARVSSDGQVGEGRDGLPRQRRAIEAFCKARKLALLDVVEDRGVSGRTPLHEREGLSTALLRCTTDGIGMLVVEAADRVGRDVVVSELALSAFRDAGVQVVTANGTDLTVADDGDAGAVLVRQLLGVIAGFARSELVGRLRRAREAKRRNGGHASGRYRYGQDPRRPGEAATLARIAELRAAPRGRQRASWAAVAAALNAEGSTNRSGGPWTVPGLKRVCG